MNDHDTREQRQYENMFDSAPQSQPEEQPGLSLDLGAQLHLAISGLAEEVRQERCDRERREQARLAALPIPIGPLAKSVTIPAAQYGIIDFGTPQVGRWWHLRALGTVVHQQDLTAQSFAAVWYTGTLLGVPGVYTAEPTQLEISGSQIMTQFGGGTGAPPSVGTLPSATFYTRSGDHLFVLIRNDHASTLTYDAVVYFNDEPVKRVRAVTEA